MPGGASCLTSVTELEPAAGPQASVAPAKFASHASGDKRGEYAYERRYLDGVPSQAVIIDSKQSQLNRCEAALHQAITDGHPTLSMMPAGRGHLQPGRRHRDRTPTSRCRTGSSTVTCGPGRLTAGRSRSSTPTGRSATPRPANARAVA